LSPRVILISLLPLLLGVGVWVQDGARIAFWLTSIEERKEVPIVDGMPELGTQMQIIWKDQFVSGVETPLLSLLLSLSIAIFLFARKRRKSS
jgi:hypothetical protein